MSILDTQEACANELSEILINGFPHAGDILLDGARFDPGDSLTAIRNGVGIVGPQAGRVLCDNLAGPENLALLYRRRHKSGNPMITNRLPQLFVSEFGGELEGLDPTRPLCDAGANSYIRLKLAYLKWIIYRPKLLICLKPFASGDVLMREVAASMIRKAALRGVCVLVISSNPKEAWVCCDRIGLITQGRISHTMSQDEFSRIISDN